MNHSTLIVAKRKALLEKIKRIAKQQGLSHEDLGVTVGVQQQTVSRILNGRFSPYTDAVIALTDAIGYDLILVEKK